MSTLRHHHGHGGGHEHDHGAKAEHKGRHKQSDTALAFSATVHCLIGCGVGEVVGVIIGTALALSMLTTMVIAILLGFVFGFLLGMLPLLRAGFSMQRAFKQVLIAEGLSIAVMEAFEVGTQLVIPGVMEAGLTDSLFWFGMLAALVVGFIAAYPVNLIMIRRGVRHQH